MPQAFATATANPAAAATVASARRRLVACRCARPTAWCRRSGVRVCARGSLGDGLRRAVLPGLCGSQAELVTALVASGYVRSPAVERCLAAVDRRVFLGDGGLLGFGAYADKPLPLGYGQTISAPKMHATALELLHPHLPPGGRALDVGSGSGYLTACMSLLVGRSGYVLGIERLRPLALRSASRLQALSPQLGLGRCAIVHGNALADALVKEEPFHAIHVGAAAEGVPRVLVDKLLPGGRLVIPVGPVDGPQVLLAVDKGSDGSVSARQVMGVRYVPLTAPT